MHQFDIRITGETPDPEAFGEAVHAFVADATARGVTIHHGSLNGLEIRVPSIIVGLPVLTEFAADLLRQASEADEAKELTDAIEADNARRPDSAGNL